MSGFSELVRGFCIIAVSGGLLLIMSPEGNLKKYVKFVLSLCMVCALLSVFFTFSENAEGVFHYGSNHGRFCETKRLRQADAQYQQRTRL